MDTWPTETDLLVVPGTNRVTLSVQLPTMRLVLQDTFEFVWASLVFRGVPEPHGYPCPY